MHEIHVSAVLLQRADGAVLLVRKRGTHVFMNPGGKPLPGESPLDCAVREVAEELDLELDADALTSLGQRVTVAANEAGFTVRADCFRYERPVPDDLRPAAEIVETLWHRPGKAPTRPLAPLYTDHLEALAR